MSHRPGRELDLLVAEKVMGQIKWLEPAFQERYAGSIFVEAHKNKISSLEECPQYSTDIAAAWEVVEKMKTEKMYVYIDISPLGNHRVRIESRQLFSSDQGIVAIEDTAPHAICLAALKAKGVEV